MKIILFEYMTGGALSQQELPKIAHEGELMLQTIGQGLTAIDGVSLIALRDSRLANPPFSAEVIWVGPDDDFSEALFSALDSADAFWPIAPETQGILSNLCRLAESKDCLVLNPSSFAVEQFSKKLETYHYLTDHQIDCVQTLPVSKINFPQAIDMVVKPNDGVGCENTYLVPAGEIPDVRDTTLICQPFIEGITASMSVIYSPIKTCLVAVNRQNILLNNNKFTLKSCEVNGLSEYQDEACIIANDIYRAYPDLCGYVGIDFMITDSAMCVLELNPRVTTSFVGLPESIGFNPCQLILDAMQGKTFKCPSQRIPVEVMLDE